MNRRNFLQTLGTAVPAAAATAWMTRPSQSEKRAAKDVAERILDTRQMNCSYIPFAPMMTKDPNTGKLGGLFFDLTERMGELAGLDIKWNHETTYATFTEDLRMGKSDVFGGGIWSNPQRAQAANFSLPVFYSGVGIYVRSNDHRFDGDAVTLNDPKFRVATIDGEMSQIIQEKDFPQASVLGLPNNTDIAMLAENVVDGKADATFMDKAAAALYLQKNPGSLRSPANAKPIRIFENTWAFCYGSERLKGIIDSAVKDMIFSGYVDQVLAKNGQEQGFYRVRMPAE